MCRVSNLAKISARLFFTLYWRFVNKYSFMESVNDIPLKVETSLLPVCFFHLSKFTGESQCFLKNEMKRGKGFPSSFRAHPTCHGIWKSEDLSLWLGSVALPWKWAGVEFTESFWGISVCVPPCLSVSLAGGIPEWAALWAFSLASPLCTVTWKINTVKNWGEAILMYENVQYSQRNKLWQLPVNIQRAAGDAAVLNGQWQCFCATLNCTF